jgi:hypothetical protein
MWHTDACRHDWNDINYRQICLITLRERYCSRQRGFVRKICLGNLENVLELFHFYHLHLNMPAPYATLPASQIAFLQFVLLIFKNRLVA